MYTKVIEMIVALILTEQDSLTDLLRREQYRCESSLLLNWIVINADTNLPLLTSFFFFLLFIPH